MTRVMLFVTGVLVCALVAVPVSADDPPKKLTAEERKELKAKWDKLEQRWAGAYQVGKYPEATKAVQDALEVARRLYPKAEFPDGHANLATSLNNLGFLYQSQGKYADAEPLYKDALEMRKRLFKGDHPDVAQSLSNLGLLYKSQVKYADAEPLLKDALKVLKRLFKGDHPDLANSLNNLGLLYESQGKYADAEPLLKDALEMKKRLFKGDHPDMARSLNKLAILYQSQGKYADAEPLYKDALEMRKRLFKGDHSAVSTSLNNLGLLYQSQRKYADAEPLLKDALEMRKRLFKGDHPDVAQSLNNLGLLYDLQGKYADAEPLYKDALEMRKRLFKGDHPDVASSLNNLGLLSQSQGKYADAEPLLKDALEMRKRLFKGDHPDLANSLNNLAGLYQSQGKYADAEPLYKDALEMRKRLFKGDHPDVATSLNNLGFLYKSRGKYADAEPLLKDALEMTKRLFKGDHPAVAASLNNLAGLYKSQVKYADAEPLYKDALEMTRRLFKGDHPDVAMSLNNLANLYVFQGKYADAETLLKDALEMTKRLFKGDHPNVASSLSNRAALYQSQGKYADAETLYKDALEMSRRMTVAFAKQKSEGESLTFVAKLPLYRDALLTVVRQRAFGSAIPYDPTIAYPSLWAAKGTIARVFEQRQFQARAVATNPALTRTLTQLVDTRRHRPELLLAPKPKNLNTAQQREAQLKDLDKTIATLTDTLTRQLPVDARAERLNGVTLDDVQKALPTDTAVVDFYHFTFFEWDDSRPVGEKEKRTKRYAAFVVTRDKVVWVDLDTAAKIEPAVNAWREAITGRDAPDDDPRKAIPPAPTEKTTQRGTQVRELVWDKVRKQLPAHVKVVYLCPEETLCKVPFAALPGDKPGTILLEDFALATIPHVPFLLDKLWPQDPLKNSPSDALAVGGVKYNAELATPTPDPKAPAGPLVKPDAKLGWSPLDNTAGEANGFAAAAQRKKITTLHLEGEKATTSAVLAALPRVKYAHFATHGFFADPSFRGIFQLDEKDFDNRFGERVGRAVNNPLVMTGLVLAGANNPKTPGRGILTGEQLIDLDLSGLDLAVLSACETGLGDVAGGEGVYGLQRAFHYAGTTNVVASLWKVPDAPTAALMALFYRNLWTRNLSPMEALRQAQLELFKNPDKVAELSKGFRGKFDIVIPIGEVEVKPGKDGKAHPLWWAAFTLSGPGR